jgi:replication factor A2
MDDYGTCFFSYSSIIHWFKRKNLTLPYVHGFCRVVVVVLGFDYQGGGGGGGGGFNSGGGSGRGGGGGGRGGGGRPSSGYSSQSGGGGDRSGGGAPRKSYDEQTMVPITINMALASCPDESAEGSDNQQLADGRKLYHVRLVAAIRSVDNHSTNVLYTVEDGTGLMEVKQWIDDDACTAANDARRECCTITAEPWGGRYLKITGQIKDYDGKKMIVAESVRVLHTGNELAHHMLEVVYAEQNWQRKQMGTGNNMHMMMGGGTGVGFGGSMATPSNQRQRAQQPLASQSGGGAAADGGLRDKVLAFIQANENGNDQGASVPECIQNLQFTSGFSEGAVRKMVDDLASEGLIYSTVDEDHFMFAS